MRGTSWLTVFLVIILGSALGIAGGTYLATMLPGGKNGLGLGNPFNPWGGKTYVRILMMGEDNTGGEELGLTDTLVVVGLNTETKEVRAISIPRDTRVEIPGHGTQKINAAHRFGGPELTKEVVEDLLHVKIDNYVKTSTKGLRGLVDLVGGVYIKIDKDMRYTDRRGGLYINLKAGPEKQLLDGDQAEQYVRFRHDRFGDSGVKEIEEDGQKVYAGRIVRQQIFVRALANRILSMPSKRDRAKVLSEAYEKQYIVSDLNMSNWDSFADFFKDIKPEEMVMEVLPGSPGMVGGGSYWIPDEEDLIQAVNRTLLFQALPAESAKVEVLNGSGISGAAGKIADKLKEAGYEVTRTDNADSFDYDKCCIIARNGKTEPVQRLAELLHCDVKEEDITGDADVTVIVGRNFESLN